MMLQPLMPPPDKEEPRCWGSLITGHQQCVPGFIPGTPPRAPRQISRIFLSAPQLCSAGTAHMKNKFCDNCRAGVAIPGDRVRGIAAEHADLFTNTSMAGFWNTSPQMPCR